jgi:hypothetical protein
MQDRKAAPRWMFSNEQADALKERFGWEVESRGSFMDAIIRNLHTKDGSRLAAEKGAK